MSFARKCLSILHVFMYFLLKIIFEISFGRNLYGRYSTLLCHKSFVFASHDGVLASTSRVHDNQNDIFEIKLNEEALLGI